MKILIIGGNGFIGSHILEQLRHKKYHITVFGRSPNPFLTEFKDVHYIYGDYNDTDSVKKALFDVDIVYHILTTTFPLTADENPEADVQTNLIGMIRLLEALSKQKIKKFIFASSGGTVYGNPQYAPQDENHPLHPLGSYGIVKVAIEQYIQMYAKKYNISFLIIRLSNAYGPRQNFLNKQGVISIFLYKVIKKEILTIFGDGNTRRDYIYISDVADFFIIAGLSKEVGVFNLGFNSYSVNEIISIIHKISGLKSEVKYIEAAAFNDQEISLSTTKIWKKFKWKPKISLEEGITMQYTWMVNQLKT